MRPVVLGSLVLLLAPFAALQAHAGQACLAGVEPGLPVVVPTLNVSISAEHPSYRNGQVALLDVEVRRLSASGSKVGGAEITISVSSGGHIVRTLYAKADASGVSRPVLRITSGLPSGKLTAVAMARALVLNGYDCSGGLLYESGEGSADPLTSVT